LIYEMHPMLDMFDPETGMEVKHSYFRTTPYYEDSAPDYMDPDTVVDAPSYWFHHKTSDKEYGHDISEVFKAFQDFENKPAMCYTLVVSKT